MLSNRKKFYIKSNFTSWYDLNIVINNLNMINTKKKYKKKKINMFNVVYEIDLVKNVMTTCLVLSVRHAQNLFN